MKLLWPTLALILTAPHTQAQAVTDLWRLLGNGQTTLHGADFVYQVSDAAGLNLNMGMSFGELKGDGYASLRITAFKFTGNLTTKELQLFGNNVFRVASTCFNTDASRAPVMQAWILSNDAVETQVYYTAGTHFAQQDFGPLHLELERRLNGKAHSVTVYMSRKGTPGQAPWIKSCTASG